ncbi:Endonuclease V [hydrothermal vent metagenome]|uniref:Endonuclease V n=1 Tax=hydrothermal vent metagenome TaxID=652676 RepID=A0A1W1BJ16_9ZZZZ
MIYALDVQYNGDKNGLVACLGFKNWEDEKAFYTKTDFIEHIEPYKAGSFYKRELPCLLEALKDLDDIKCIVVDGYVWLEEPTHYGLGMHLYDALNSSTPIIGVAKTLFTNTPKECELLRGESSKPLFVTSVGIELDVAKRYIEKMHGKYRFPTLLKEVDSLAREKLEGGK